MVEAILGVVILVAVIFLWNNIGKVFTLNWFKSISKNKKEVY